MGTHCPESPSARQVSLSGIEHSPIWVWLVDAVSMYTAYIRSSLAIVPVICLFVTPFTDSWTITYADDLASLTHFTCTQNAELAFLTVALL